MKGRSELLDLAEFTQTLGLIYDVAMAPERWPDLLGRLGRDFGCHFAGVVTTNRDRSAFHAIAVGVDHDEHQRYLGRFHQHNPVRVAAPHRFAGQIVDMQEVMPRPVLERSEMYPVYFRPNDIGDGLSLTTWKGDDGAQAISLLRSWKTGPFAAAGRARLQFLSPHLQRMAQVIRHLRRADLMVRSAEAALDAVPQATILLDRTGRLIHANAAADALLRAGDGIAARRDGLVGASAAATSQLAALIGRAARAPRVAGTMRLARPSGKLALAVVAMPMRDPGAFALTEAPAVLLCIADPAARDAVAPRLLMTVLGLTRAEAALAVQLLEGHDLRAIAEQSARSVNTLRNLLARLMAKTDTHRQSDLVRLLDQLSRLPRGH